MSYSYEALRDGGGLDLGASRWVLIDQERINRFADVTEDHQWIHVDVERAKSGSFGSTIAHGYLTISLVATLLSEMLQVEPGLVMVNYGLDSLRFTTPVPVNSRLRAIATITAVDETPRGLRLTLTATAEVDGTERPACRATQVILVSRESSPSPVPATEVR